MKNIHLVPTDKPSRLVKVYDDANRENFTVKLDVEVNDSFKEYVNVYITSDEEIKDGDYYYDNIVLQIRQWKSFMIYNSVQHFKIILTTDQDLIADGVQEIDDEFLVWFIENSNCEEINIETIMECDNCGREHCDNLQCRGYKDSPYYKIIIPKEELNYNVKQVKKNNLKNTQFEYELQAMIYEVLKENNNSSIELQSSKLVECVTDYFNHIECTFIIKNGDKTNVKKGKLV
jgi:hypothetical protein